MTIEPHVPPRPDSLHPAQPAHLRPDTRAVGRPLATWSWLEAVGIYVLAFLVAGIATLPLIGLMDEDTDLATIVATTIAALVIVGVLVGWLSIRHRGWPAVMGVPRRGVWTREVGAGVLFGIGLYPVMVVVVGGLLVVVLEAISGQRVEAPEQVGQNLSAVGTAVTIVYAIAIAPVGEELFFRGVLFRALRDRHGFVVGAIGSGLGFGLIHFIPGPAVDAALLMIVMFFTGVALAFVYERRGTILTPIAAHVTFNVIGIVLILGLR